MTLVALNSLVDGFSGKFGRSIVFKTIRGKTYASPVARKPDKRKQTAAQRETRTNFQKASAWAKQMMLDPTKKAYYRQRAEALGLPNAYTAAITDYMRSPQLTQIPTKDDSTLCNVSKKDFPLVSVTVTTHSENGAIKETLNVQSLTENNYVFTLTAMQRNVGAHLNVIDASGRVTRWLISDQQT